MTYGDFKDLNRIIFANKVLCDKAFNIAKGPKYDGYQCGLASIVYEFFNEKLLVVLKRSVIDIYSKYAWVIPLQDKESFTIANAFQKILKESNCKPNKIWVDRGSEFHNRSMKSWLEKNDMEMHSTHNEGKSVVTERFIRTLKNKIYKYMTSVSKNVYIDKLDDKVSKYNNTYHSAIKMRPADVKTNIYIESSNEINHKNL